MINKYKLQRTTWGLAVSTLVLVVAGYTAVAATARMRPPTVVVTFNIEDVLEGLDERADAEAKLETLRNKITDEKKKRGDSIIELQELLKSVSDADKEELVEELVQLRYSYDSYDLYSKKHMDGERALMLQDLYYKIQTAVEEVATESGYDIVLINDVGRSVNPNDNSKIPREIQVLELISQRRAIFASEQVDISDQIVTHMNLEWGTTHQ
ncbi:MAG: OmpH family outer membrane protein [Phycisphaerales bacterium]|jgi:Skp family chaperone for outer membrane proteins|nr:OmpH family outer membrane protein [Phycisphaerales bacterium]